jgi:hypothetical protein
MRHPSLSQDQYISEAVGLKQRLTRGSMPWTAGAHQGQHARDKLGAESSHQGADVVRLVEYHSSHWRCKHQQHLRKCRHLVSVQHNARCKQYIHT